MSKRIKAKMNMVDVIYAMSGGNPGAVRVCGEIFKQGPIVDPEAWSPLVNLFELDELEIYDDRLNVLYVYVCKESVGNLIALLRAHQQGQLAGITREVIDQAIDQRGGIDLEAVIKAVREQTPSFSPDATRS